MPPENEKLPPEAVTALTTAFALPAPAAPSLDALHRLLTHEITALLDRNPALLMHALYRVDVAERAVKQAFAETPAADLPARLADLLIARQLQKLDTRRRYGTAP